MAKKNVIKIRTTNEVQPLQPPPRRRFGVLDKVRPRSWEEARKDRLRYVADRQRSVW